MIKVLFFIPTLGGGGAERVLVNLVNNMNSTQFDITILTLFDGGNNKKYLKSNVNYRYIFKKSFRGNSHFLKLFSPNYLARKFIREDYDIAVSYLEGPTTRILSGIQNEDTKKLNWVHAELTKKQLLTSYRSFKEFVQIYQEYDCSVFVSETAKEAFENVTKLKSKNIVKYNTVEANRIQKLSKQDINDVKYKTDEVKIITVGRLTKQKGYDRLLPIINKLVQKHNNLHLYILGEGHLEPKIKEFISENKLENYVTMLGYRDNPYKYVKQADLFVCSSYSEGFSTAVTESLIVGTPVITTRVSGMEEMLGKNSEYGLIVENDTESLYEGLKKILSNKILLDQYKKKAVERSTFFDTEKTVKEVERLILELHNQKS